MSPDTEMTTNEFSPTQYHRDAWHACMQASSLEYAMGNTKESKALLQDARDHYAWLYKQDSGLS